LLSGKTNHCRQRYIDIGIGTTAAAAVLLLPAAAAVVVCVVLLWAMDGAREKAQRGGRVL